MSCTVYRWVHIPPAPATSDRHHLVPRAWQAFYRPPGETRVLWAPETVECCPNDHRRIHEAIQRIMHGGPKRRVDKVSRLAQQGIDRFTAAGGSLEALKAAGLYGEQ